MLIFRNLMVYVLFAALTGIAVIPSTGLDFWPSFGEHTALVAILAFFVSKLRGAEIPEPRLLTAAIFEAFAIALFLYGRAWISGQVDFTGNDYAIVSQIFGNGLFLMFIASIAFTAVGGSLFTRRKETEFE